MLAWCNECIWVAFAVATQQYGFILGAIVYGTINMANAIVWKRDAKKEKPTIIR